MQITSTLLALVAATGAYAAMAVPPSPNALQPRLSNVPVYRRHGDGAEDAAMPNMPGMSMGGGKGNGSMPMPVPVAGAPSARGDASLVALAVCGVAGLIMGVAI